MSILQILEEHLTLFTFIPSILFLIYLYKWISTKPQNSPPSPQKLPILGHLHKLGKYPHRSLYSLSKQYGDIMLIHLGSKPTLVVSSASVAKEIMKTNDAIMSNRTKSSISDRLLYNSRDVAAAPYGEYWRQMKSVFVLQLLSNRRVRSFRSIREEETKLMIDKIKESKSGVVNLSEMFYNLTSDVICRVTFGKKYGGVNFRELLNELIEMLGVFDLGDFIPWLAWVNGINGFNKRGEKVAKAFDCLLEQMFDEHLERLNREGKGDSEKEYNKEEVKDFVDVLFEVQREKAAGFPIERDSIKAMILDVFGGGIHTSSTVIEWAMTELLRYPTIMKKLQDEIRTIVGDNEDITEDDLEKMKYLKAVIKETLRLYPPIPLLVPRESTQDAKIKGYNITANTLVITNAWAIQRDPAIWEEPEEFRPERFLNSTVDFKGLNFELIPFGSGRRICPGILFAMANNELALAKLVHKFNWALPSGVTSETLDMSESIGLTIRRKTPLLAVATPQIFNQD